MDRELLVNERLKYSRESIRQINHAMGIIEDPLEDFKTLIFAGMLSYYGQEYIKDIYLAFLKTNFVTTNYTIHDLISKMYNLGATNLNYLSNHAPGTFYDATAVKKGLIKYQFKRTIYTSKEEVDCTTLLESLTHQINHVLNSIHNPIVYNQGDLYARMGVAVEQLVKRGIAGLGIEEAINRLQIADIMNEISTFRTCKIMDEPVGELLTRLSPSVNHKEEDNAALVQEIRPLYQNEAFQYLLVKKRISGEIDHISTEFNSKTNFPFTKLLYFGDAFQISSDSSVKNSCCDVVKTLVKRYNETCDK